MPARAKDKRWNSKFARFVDAYGAPLLARRLNVTRDALYKWISGVSHMRPIRAKKIVKMAARRKIELTLDDVYQNFDFVRGTLSRKP